MPEPRSRISIGELLQGTDGSVKTGPFGTVLKSHEYSDQGAPVISVREVGYGEFRIEESTPRAPPAVQERLPDYLLQPGDIVFGRKGAVDRAAAVEPRHGRLFLGSDGIRLRPPSSVNATYLAYAVRTPESKAWLTQHATGSTMPSLSQGIIERLPVHIPASRAEQEAIVSILKPLDDRIALNHAMNQTLEDIARAIFKSWFIEHDPVHAKAEGRSTGLPPEIDALFPSGFVETEEGMVPEGWRIQAVGELAEFVKGKVPKGRAPHPDTGLEPVVDMAAIHGAPASWASAKGLPRCELTDTLLVMDGSSSGLVVTGMKGILGSTLAILQPKSPLVSPNWFFQHIKNREDLFMSHRTGTSIPHTDKDLVLRQQVAMPPTSVLESFEAVVQPMVGRQEIARSQSKCLAEIRDLLLPRLVSGDLRLPVEVLA